MSGLYLPGAQWKPIVYRKDAGSFAPGMPIGYIPHVPVSNGSLYNYFEGLKSPNRKFATAWIAKTGSSEQYTELTGKPWAQVDGNAMYHAFEVEGFPNEPYTPAQLQTLATWHNYLGTPDLLAEAPGQPGIGTHYMGGKAWGAHTCPDAKAGVGPRSRQRQAIIDIARFMRTHPGSIVAPLRTIPLDLFPEEDMKDLVIACYHKVCGRPYTAPPSADEVNGWLVSAAKGGWTPKQLVASFADTTEAKNFAKK